MGRGLGGLKVGGGMAASEKMIYWKRTHPKGELRFPAYPDDAGFDLVVCERAWVNNRETTKVNCGIKIALPENVSAFILGRSSAVISGVIVVTTLIDSGYRGPIYCMAYCLGNRSVVIEPGARIAQIVPFRMLTEQLGLRLAVSGVLPESRWRGEQGFGSTGGTDARQIMEED